MMNLLVGTASTKEKEFTMNAPYGWIVSGCSGLRTGQFAEIDAKADAKRCGGTAHAIALYTVPEATMMRIVELETLANGVRDVLGGPPSINIIECAKRAMVRIKELEQDAT